MLIPAKTPGNIPRERGGQGILLLQKHDYKIWGLPRGSLRVTVFEKAKHLFQVGVLQISATGLFLKHGEDEVCAVVSRALILLGGVYRPYGSRPYTLTNPLRNPKDRKQLALLEVPRIEIKI